MESSRDTKCVISADIKNDNLSTSLLGLAAGCLLSYLFCKVMVMVIDHLQ